MYGFNIRRISLSDTCKLYDMIMKGGEVATWQVGVNNHAWNGEWVGKKRKCKISFLCFLCGFRSCYDYSSNS